MSTRHRLAAYGIGIFLSVLLGALDKAVADVDVVDSAGTFVGTYSFVPANVALGSASVVRQINGFWFQLPVLATGFVAGGANIVYSGADCTGNAYMQSSPNAVVLDAVTPQGGAAAVNNGILSYPDPTVQPSSQLVCSELVGGPEPSCENFGPNLGGGCHNVRNFQPRATFDLSTLNLSPPFQLQQLKHKQ